MRPYHRQSRPAPCLMVLRASRPRTEAMSRASLCPTWARGPWKLQSCRCDMRYALYMVPESILWHVESDFITLQCCRLGVKPAVILIICCRISSRYENLQSSKADCSAVAEPFTRYCKPSSVFSHWPLHECIRRCSLGVCRLELIQPLASGR